MILQRLLDDAQLFGSSPAAPTAANTATSAGASVVAAGIAEALINTAAGLFVAIPAVIFYNYFLSKTNYFAKELENAAHEVIFRQGEGFAEF